MHNKEYLIKNACYSVTKYYLCKQNNKRSLLGRKQRSQVVRSFPNRYQFSCTNKVTSLFSDRYIFIIILQRKTYALDVQNNWFCKAFIIKELHDRYFYVDFLHYSSIFPVLSTTYIAAFQASANNNIFLYTMLAQEILVLVFIAIKDVYINVAVYATDSPVRT